MCEKSSSESLLAAAKRLQPARSLLILTHVHPDGDALGSAAGLAESATSAGKVATIIVPGGVPARYEFVMVGQRLAGAEQLPALAAKADAIVVLDTCSLSQLGDLADKIRPLREKVVVIDHHVAPDDIGAVQWVDGSAAAVGVMVGELLEALGWPVTLRSAKALATAVLTDTGWLRFANVDRRCLAMVGRWIEAGIRPDELYRQIYQSDRPERLRLMARMLGSIELHCAGRLAVMALLADDFADTGARRDETENLVSEAFRVGSVEAAVLFVQEPEGVRASLRSRGAIDVASVAQRFGGGGHPQAAGCRGNEAIEDFKRRLIAACRQALEA